MLKISFFTGWRENRTKNNLFFLFEQIQLSQIFDISLIIIRPSLTNPLTAVDFRLQARFNRVFFHKLRHAFNSQFQCYMIQKLRSLEKEIENPHAAFFSVNFKKISIVFEFADVRHLTFFHVLIIVFEFFALYLMFRICRTGFFIFQFWINIHLPWFFENRRSFFSEVLSDSNIHIYKKCLINLTRDFVRMISRLNSFAFFDITKGFCLNIRIYLSRLFHRRNVEFLSVAIINLRTIDINLSNVTRAETEIFKMNKIKLPGFDFRNLSSIRFSSFVFSVPIILNTEPFRNSSRNWSSHMISTKKKILSSSLKLLQNIAISKTCCRNLG